VAIFACPALKVAISEYIHCPRISMGWIKITLVNEWEPAFGDDGRAWRFELRK
jgi:hypothetical protein